MVMQGCFPFLQAESHFARSRQKQNGEGKTAQHRKSTDSSDSLWPHPAAFYMPGHSVLVFSLDPNTPAILNSGFMCILRDKVCFRIVQIR